MDFYSSVSWLLMALLSLVVTLRADSTELSTVTMNGVAYKVSSIINRDICIIGGGSTGTYSAIRLSDMGKTVVVVEKLDSLGGHTNTYTDPITGKKIDYGVVVFHDLPIVHDYFARLNVSLIKRPASTVVTQYYDFKTGKPASFYVPVDPSAAFAAYGAQVAKYPYLEQGFDLPYPVPADLLLPWGEFIVKYNLQGMAGSHFQFAQGMGDLFSQPTLYVIKNFGADILRNLRIGFLATKQLDNSLLYDSAAANLGANNLLFNSSILEMDRSDPQVAKVIVKTCKGLVLIKARQLVFTIPPKLDNLHGWDLSSSERGLFKQFLNTGYYTALVRNSGLPQNTTFRNVSPNTKYNTAELPGVYIFTATGVENLHTALVGSPESLPDAQVKKLMIEAIKRLEIPGRGSISPEFAAYSSHAPFELTVSPTAIADGFYKQLYSLQGQRHTWYTGAAFHTHDSSLLWQFTETVLANMTAT